MFKVEFAVEVKKQIKQIPKSYQSSIRYALVEIKEDPFLGKPLIKEFIGRFSFKVGPYRIIYTINKKDKIITVISAGHRANVYT